MTSHRFSPAKMSQNISKICVCESILADQIKILNDGTLLNSNISDI